MTVAQKLLRQIGGRVAIVTSRYTRPRPVKTGERDLFWLLATCEPTGGNGQTPLATYEVVVGLSRAGLRPPLEAAFDIAQQWFREEFKMRPDITFRCVRGDWLPPESPVPSAKQHLVGASKLWILRDGTAC